MKASLPLLLLLAGCAAVPEPRYRIAFESDPPGARVHMDKEFVGTTPCETEIIGERNGTFKPKGAPWVGIDGFSYHFIALHGTNRQEKTFRGGGPLWPGERIPQKIHFQFQTGN